MLLLIQQNVLIFEMSISTKLQQFKSTTRISLKDKFIGDQGASELAHFLQQHKGTTCLQLKSNDISTQGLIPIFQALLQYSRQTLKQLSIQFNDLSNDYVQWHDSLSALIQACPKLQRLNLSNNNISREGFFRIAQALSKSTSLKLLELKYNKITNDAIEEFARYLKTDNNLVLLYAQFVGNSKIKKQALNELESVLSKNRAKNPITKQKIIGMPGQADVSLEADRTHSVSIHKNSTFVEQIPYFEMTRYMEDILDQNRTQISENKIRLQKQLVELQKRQRIDAADLNQLERRCNQMVIVNRNLKFQLDRTMGEYEQIQRDDQAHLRAHEEKIKESTREVQDLQQKYEQIENRMNKQHELKMKEIVRDWQHRLRSVEQKIRNTQNQNKLMEGQIKKCMDRRERLRIQIVEEENGVRNRVQDQQTHRFNFKAKDLQSKLRIAESNRDGYIRRNQQIIYEIEKSNAENAKQIEELQQQLSELKNKQTDFNAKSKDFFSKNEKVKADIQMKQITLDKLQQQINRLNRQIEAKRAAGDDEHAKLRQAHQAATSVREAEKQSRVDRLSEAENSLRLAQLENGKLRQEYALLAQKLQVSLNLAVHRVFEENSLY